MMFASGAWGRTAADGLQGRREAGIGRWAALGCVLGMLWGAWTATAAEVRRETVALEGQPAPGGLSGETFGVLSRVRALVTGRGDVAFIAPIRGVRADGATVDGLFVRTSSGLVRLAQEDGVVPGLEPLRFGRLSRLGVNDAGFVVLLSQRADGEAILSNASGAWRVVARTEDPEPATLRFVRLGDLGEGFDGNPMLQSADEPEVMFPGLASAVGVGVGLPAVWTAGADGWDPRPWFRQGGEAPDLSNQPLLGGMQVQAMGGSPARRSVFQGYLVEEAGTVVSTNAHVLWYRTARGPVQVLARAGSLAGGLGGVAYYGGFHGVTVNGAGDIAFLAEVVPEIGGVERAIFAGTPESFRPVVKDGDAIVGRDGVALGAVRVWDAPVLNQAGQVLFKGILGDREVLARWTSGRGLEAMLIHQQTWLGAPDGWRVGRTGAVHGNGLGRMAFVADIETPEFLSQAWGLWVTDSTLEPVLIAMIPVERSGWVPPPGVPLLAEGLFDSFPEGFVGGGDGLPRALSEGNHVVYSGRPVGEASGVFRVSVDAGSEVVVDETFVWKPRDLPVWAGLEATESSAWRVESPARLFADIGLQARPDKTWVGASLRLEVIENLDAGADLLGLDGLGLERQRLRLVEADGTLEYAGRPLGRLSRPQPGVLEVTLDSGATTDGIVGLARVLAYGSTRGLGSALLRDARHVEPLRRIRLRLTDSGGRASEAGQLVTMPQTVGLAFEGYSIDQPSWGSGHTESTTITLKPQLRLSDGSRLSIGCSAIAEQIEWIPNASAQAFQVETSEGRRCGSASMTFRGEGGYPSLVRLQGWEARHVLRRERGFEEVFNRGYGVCLGTFFSLWMASQGDGAMAARPSLAGGNKVSSPGPGSSLPTDLPAGQYAFREWMRRTGEGRRLIGLYEEHSGEVVRHLLTDAALFGDAFQLVREFAPGLGAFLAGRGQEVMIRQDMVAQVNRVWDRLEAKGSPALRGAIQAERARHDGLRVFVGRTFAEWGERLSIGAPTTPFITASSPSIGAEGFQVEANRVEGVTYSLWRRAVGAGSVWEAVANAGIRVMQATIRLVDPRPEPEARLYQVRAVVP